MPRPAGRRSGVLAVVAQIVEDNQLDEYRLQLREARDGIRTAYPEAVREIERAFWVRFEDFSKDFYGSELAAVDDMLAGLVDQRSDRGAAAKDFSSIASLATRRGGDVSCWENQFPSWLVEGPG